MSALEESCDLRDRLRSAMSELTALRTENARFEDERRQLTDELMAKTKACTSQRLELDQFIVENATQRRDTAKLSAKMDELEKARRSARTLHRSMESLREEMDALRSAADDAEERKRESAHALDEQTKLSEALRLRLPIARRTRPLWRATETRSSP